MKHRKAISLLIPAIFLLIATYYLHLSRHQDRQLLWRTWADASPTWPEKLDSFPSPHPSPPSLWPGKNTTKTLVVAKLQDDDTSWVTQLTHDDPHLTSAVYTVDNHTATLTVPTNKGHEVMVYLTYIIDHYDALNDVTLFMHAHHISWHNNDFLDSDSAQMVRFLRPNHVVRNGYMNMRCHHQPGCPDHIRPIVGSGTGNLTEDDLRDVPEAAVLGNAWRELFPADPVPRVLSQPCCAQFAVSSEQIRRIPRQRYRDYRQWVMHTELDDRLSGRVWEYIWQWLFTGEEEFCPAETSCYCEGYGLCFDPAEYDHYFKNREEARKLEKEVEEMGEDDERVGGLKKRIEELRRDMDGFKATVEKEKAKVKAKAKAQ
ncbi:hypothetical protein P170DRAFT_434249 [Aspergillus steynii IBT 23096]|uniref:Uncharacterized protein n=1 Tax=Aspergillus steynii IBT 23096 TaxID=1392250 RepID=A0A2I2GI05_9EURO|nr:uncharacterized protein P170DRAFT_434249 [Aspergillus steynii IBT 23096]PLB52513.1 hypothetical protein P170DRAFT_434249 [Aspergillus steynii IBT 23096]